MDNYRKHQTKADYRQVKVALGQRMIDFDQIIDREKGNQKPPDAEKDLFRISINQEKRWPTRAMTTAMPIKFLTSKKLSG